VKTSYEERKSAQEEHDFQARARAISVMRGLERIERLIDEGREEEAIQAARDLKAEGFIPAIPSRDAAEAVKRWVSLASEKLLPIMKKHGLVRDC